MRWYLDGVLISSDYLLAPAATSDMPDLAPTPHGQHRLGHRTAPHERDEAPTATHGQYPGHRGAVQRYEREAGTAAPGVAGTPGGAGDRVGRANYMRGQHGAPGTNLTTVETDAGTMTLNQASAPAFTGFTNELVAAGAPLGRPGSYARRNIAGSSRISQHAYGNAVDYGNQRARDVVSPAFRSWVQSHPDEWRAALNRWNMVSGGDWRNPDLGHVEWAGPRGAAGAGPDGVRGSTFDDIRTASGRSAATTPGIALPSGGKMGDQYKITTPDGRTFIAPLIDRGPAAWTGRGLDISRPLAEQMGYGKDFPTDSRFKVEPVAGPQSSLPGQVMSDADPDPVRAGQQYAANIRPDPAMGPHLGPEMAPRGGARNYYSSSGDKVVAPDYAAEAREALPVTHTGVTSPKFRAEVDEHLSRLSPKVQKTLSDAGVKIETARDSVTEAMPHLSGQGTRNTGDSRTWDQVHGIYDPISRRAVASEYIKFGSGYYRQGDNAMLHEVGHAYDHATARVAPYTEFSSSKAFREAYKADVAALSPTQRRMNRYFLQRGPTGRDETFAELFAHTHGKDTGGMNLTFPRSYSLVKEEVK